MFLPESTLDWLKFATAWTVPKAYLAFRENEVRRVNRGHLVAMANLASEVSRDLKALAGKMDSLVSLAQEASEVNRANAENPVSEVNRVSVGNEANKGPSDSFPSLPNGRAASTTLAPL
jgi:hypothetical protein